MTAHRDLTSFLTRSGWSPVSEGPSGAMWMLRPADAKVGVPHGVDRASIEWQGVIDRVAAAMRTESDLVDFRIAHQHLDESLLRAVNDELIADSIPLQAGQVMVESANKMLRAAATTARGPRANIGGYLSDGDRIYELARMGHTRRGSYVIPVLMPIPEAEPDPTAQLQIEGIELVGESIERRTMRTFAQSLTAVSKLVVEPGVMPKPSVATGLVTAGVSRQFLLALHAIVAHDSVASFGAEFHWAGAVPAPTHQREESVRIPHDAAVLISAAAVHLSEPTAEPTQVMTGPIVEWRREPDAESGWVGIQTMRKGHPTVVRVHLDAGQLIRALDYARGSVTVAVEGVPQGGRGRQVRIANPRSFRSLDELMLAP